MLVSRLTDQLILFKNFPIEFKKEYIFQYIECKTKIKHIPVYIARNV